MALKNQIQAGKASSEAFFGRLRKARGFPESAVESARHNGENETAAVYEVGMATTEADLGNWQRARLGVTNALSLSQSPYVKVLAAIVLARIGDTVRAEKMADDATEQFPLDTLPKSYSLPTVRAAIEINRKNPTKAIELLKATTRYELSYWGNLYAVYLRGLANLLLHDGTEAASDFQKILNHRGIVVNNEQGALARLGLGRAYAASLLSR